MMPEKSTVPSQAKSSSTVAQTLLRATQPVPALLVISPDRTRRDRYVQKYLTVFQEGKREDASISTFDCRDLDSQMVRAVQDAVQSLPLFSNRHFTVLTYLEELSASFAKDIADIISRSSDHISIIGVASKLSSSSVLYKTFNKQGSIVIFEELKGEMLRKWAEKECVQQGISRMSPDALTLLVQLSEGDIDRLYQCIEIAALYAEDGVIEGSDIQALFSISLSHSEFALVDEIVAGATAKARMLLSDLLREGKNPFGLIAIITRSISQILAMRIELDSGVSESRVRDRLQLPPWQFNKLISHARRVPAERWRKKLDMLLKADIRLKSRSVSIEDILQSVVA